MRQDGSVIVRLASEEDAPGFIELAGQVEQWFGPMVGEPGFRTALEKHIRQGTALVAATSEGTDMLGGLLFTSKPPMYHVRWLVISEHARGKGIGRALMADALERFVMGDGIVEVVTFGADHPRASASGARAFYERLGFTPTASVAPGPDGGSRQVFRKMVTGILLDRVCPSSPCCLSLRQLGAVEVHAAEMTHSAYAGLRPEAS
jgi:ribosomal protein S18 acetylase RimI-like enzyme